MSTEVKKVKREPMGKRHLSRPEKQVYQGITSNAVKRLGARAGCKSFDHTRDPGITKGSIRSR